MDKPAVYVETSVISYYTARPSRDPLVAAHQLVTREWWWSLDVHFAPLISAAVTAEIAAGDREQARKRLAAVRMWPILPEIPGVQRLAARYMKELPFPKRAQVDAYHIAYASAHETDFLLTWNFRHIAHALLRERITEINAEEGFQTPVICTFLELMNYDSAP